MMGRTARINCPNLIYHVIKRGNNRDVVFAEPDDYRHYLNTIQRYKKKFAFKLFAFCLMTNHLHLLIKTGEAAGISKIIQSLTVAHTRWYNFKYKRCGHVWQGRFGSPIISDDGYLLNAMKYIEQNPVRANMVKNVGDYTWSSYRLNVRKDDPEIIDRKENPVFQGLGGDVGERIRAYRDLLNEPLSQRDVGVIRVSTRKGGHYISEKFGKQIGVLLQHKRKRGRPRLQD